MDTNDLIFRLAADTKPVSWRAAERRIAGALLLGGLVTLILITATMGGPFDGVFGLGVMTLGVKLGFTLSTLLIAALLLTRAARPGQAPRRLVAWIAVPSLLLVVLAVLALVQVPAEVRSELVFGGSWLFCTVAVCLLSIPVFGALLWTFRSLAPTDLKLTGLLAGLCSGSTAAFVYALHCGETSPAFLLFWYGGAILVAGLTGRLLGPPLLRW